MIIIILIRHRRLWKMSIDLNKYDDNRKACNSRNKMSVDLDNENKYENI
jgi:hypothetical protein